MNTVDIFINAALGQRPNHSRSLISCRDFCHDLLVCLGYDAKYPPMAEFLRRYHGLEGTWLMCSPIFCQATHNDAMMIASGQDLRWSLADAKFIYDLVADYMAEEGMRLVYHDATTWLLNVTNKPHLHAPSLHAMRHQSLLPHLRRLDDQYFWQRTMTAVQILMNQAMGASQASLAHSVNGIWIWGAGDLGPRSDRMAFAADEISFRLLDCVSSRTVFLSSGISSLAQGIAVFAEDFKAGLMFKNQDDFLSHHPDYARKIKAYRVNWHWQNEAYATKPESFWFRLLGR